MINQFMQKNIQIYKYIYNLFSKPLLTAMMVKKVNLFLIILDANFFYHD